MSMPTLALPTTSPASTAAADHIAARRPGAIRSLVTALRLRRRTSEAPGSVDESGPADQMRRAPDGTADPGAEAGMATAEYAIGTLAAAAFAGLLLAVIRSGSIGGILQGLIERALSVG